MNSLIFYWLHLLGHAGHASPISPTGLANFSSDARSTNCWYLPSHKSHDNPGKSTNPTNRIIQEDS